MTNIVAFDTEKLEDRRKGALYGQAIGDALGAYYEFSGNLWPNERAQYRASMSFEAGEWTDDTEQSLILLRAFVASPDDMEEATKLLGDGFHQWLHEDGRGCGNHTARVLTDLVYALDPVSISKEKWQQSGKKSAPNGGVMRTVGAALVRPWDIGWTTKAATVGCQVTHFDPRCVASAVAVSVSCAFLICGESIPSAFRKGIEAGAAICPDIKEYLTASLNKLQLGGPFKGYTYKCAGAGFWALREFQRHDEDQHLWRDRFENILNDVIRERGDTDTNAAVAGALMGARIGFQNLPEPLVAGLQRTEKLDELLGQLPEGP